jgi:hypothetical protein
MKKECIGQNASATGPARLRLQRAQWFYSPSTGMMAPSRRWATKLKSRTDVVVANGSPLAMQLAKRESDDYAARGKAFERFSRAVVALSVMRPFTYSALPRYEATFVSLMFLR